MTANAKLIQSNSFSKVLEKLKAVLTHRRLLLNAEDPVRSPACILQPEIRKSWMPLPHHPSLGETLLQCIARRIEPQNILSKLVYGVPYTTSSTERCKDTEKIFSKSNCGHLSILHICKHWRHFSNKGCYNSTKISVFVWNGVRINAFSAISGSPWHRLPHCHEARKMHFCMLRVSQVLPFLFPNVQNGLWWSSADLHQFLHCRLLLSPELCLLGASCWLAFS